MKTISIKGTYHKYNNYTYIDFYIYIDGEADAILYRQYNCEKKFKKILGFGNTYGKAVRGKLRECAQNLVNEMLTTRQTFAIAIIQ